MGSGYRKDIDGLRAIAVLSVLAYHVTEDARFAGFLGVDVFFTISGFLITGLLIQALEDSSFTFTGFYVRRVKRIVPALFAMVAATLAFGSFTLDPEEALRLAKSALASVFAASNLFFMRDGSEYFALSSRYVPLLHTWSLAIEEQFYFLWPAVLALFHRGAGRKFLLPASLVLALASYLLAEWHFTGSSAYYLLPSRMGELLLGAIAFLLARASKGASRTRWAEIQAFVGLGLIAISMINPEGKEFQPGLRTLWPCLGTALILHSGKEPATWVSRALSFAPMVGVGKISYSLYLWHWPVLAFLRIFFTEIPPGAMAMAMALIFGMAVLSYRFLEQPIRRAAIGPGMAFGALLLAPALALTAFSLRVYALGGVVHGVAPAPPGRPAEAGSAAMFHAAACPFICQGGGERDGTWSDSRCVLGKEGVPPSALLVGDSHAAHFGILLGLLAEAEGFAIRNVEQSGCPPVLRPEIGYVEGHLAQACAEYRARMKAAMAEVPIVFLGAAWESYAQDPRFLADFEETLDSLAGMEKQVYVLAQVPVFKDYNRDCRSTSNPLFTVDCIGQSSYMEGSGSTVRKRLGELAATRPGVRVLDFKEWICPGGNCSPYHGGMRLYYDTEHLSVYGSWWVGTRARTRGMPGKPAD